MLVQCSILELTLLHCHALESRSYVWALDYDATSVTAVTLVNKILDGQFESDMHCKLVCLHKKSIVEKTHLLFQHTSQQFLTQPGLKNLSAFHINRSKLLSQERMPAWTGLQNKSM